MSTTPRFHNWIAGAPATPSNGAWLDKFNPHTGELLCQFAGSTIPDVEEAIGAACRAFPAWAETTPVMRGQLLGKIAALMKRRANELAECVRVETGKPPADAAAEVGGAILQAEYFAGEGMRLHGRSLTSAMPGKSSHTVRQPRGVAGLIVPANTPIANIAWKTFPALICGNTVVLKAAEDAPGIADLFTSLTEEAGAPAGVFNVVHGLGAVAGAALIEDPRVQTISFTGSTTVGRRIAEVAGRRLARLSLELGGKNAFVVCDDADLEKAVQWACLSAFSNAGQRCAAGSRLLIFEDVYTEFRDKFVAKARTLKLGIEAGCDLGPVVSRRQQQGILAAIQRARLEGAVILSGGSAPSSASLANGYYVEPTVVEGLPLTAELSCREVFGPVVTLHTVADLKEAVEAANASEYGLTAAIHTRNIDRAMWFVQKVKAGVANVNLGTFGSEPHMPFGGFGWSGNGSREPGVEALDVYSELKNISILARGELV